MDKIFEICIELAKQSPCQKRGFGSVLVLLDGERFSSFNAPSRVTKHICDGECVRFKLESGTDSLIGACYHSEELAIWSAINHYQSVQGGKLYVAGVSKPDNSILEKKEPFFYCIRCATLMNIAGLAGVHVWCNDEWNFMTSEEAYESSLQFALRQEVVKYDKKTK